jgi:hypothetical protein
MPLISAREVGTSLLVSLWFPPRGNQCRSAGHWTCAPPVRSFA